MFRLGPQYYIHIYLIFVTLLSLIVFSRYTSYRQTRIILGNRNSSVWGTILSILLIAFIGLRPISGKFFVDMYGYYELYDALSDSSFSFDWKADNLLFDNLFIFLSTHNVAVEVFFLLIAAIYFCCIAYACSSLFPSDKLSSLLVYLGAFSTFSYATNGIKAGAAASLFLVVLALYEKRKWLWMILFMLLSLGFHHAMILPIVAFIVCIIIRDPRLYFAFWALCLIIAVLHVTYFQHLFAGFTDEQGAGYLLGEGETIRKDVFGGFRLDFILYSVAPIIVGWIAIFKKQIRSRGYIFLLNLYLLTNAVWLLCMYAEFTNRIAYLSWFILPIVLVYPFLREKWGLLQYRTFMLVAFGHLAFTLFMQYIY